MGHGTVAPIGAALALKGRPVFAIIGDACFTMNVMEQIRELGMLRAIGMRRGQIVKIVLGQAVLIGLLGIVAGGVAGTSLARMINISLGSMFGHHIGFALRPQFMALMLVVALAVVLLSALVPARRAARLNPIQAMRQE